MSKIKYILCTCLILLFCVFSLAVPALAAAWQEKLLMQKPAVREETQNVLSEEARKIPIAYALHKRKLVDSSYTGSEGEFTPKLKQEMLAVLQGLKDAEILPKEAYNEICAGIESPIAEFYCAEDKIGFKEISFNLTERKGTVVTSVHTQLVLQWHSDTALATRFSFNSSQLDYDKAIKAYQKYLGVDVLSDWHKINENGAIYSDMGQLYMLCKQKDNTAYFTIAPVSLDEILNK